MRGSGAADKEAAAPVALAAAVTAVTERFLEDLGGSGSTEGYGGGRCFFFCCNCSRRAAILAFKAAAAAAAAALLASLRSWAILLQREQGTDSCQGKEETGKYPASGRGAAADCR